MSDWRAFVTLLRFSFKRLFWSMNSVMMLLPMIACGMFVARRDFQGMKDPQEAFHSFSQFLLFVFSSFLIPICALGFGTTALGAEREEQTLVFLLTRPIPRWQVLLAKILASLPLAVGFVLGSFGVYCWIAGPIGVLAWKAYWPAMLGMTVAYLALFHLFAVAFRHPTMLALVYALFMELFVANLPGTIKRVAVNYYGRSLLYDLGKGTGLRTPRGFETIPPGNAYLALWGIAAGCLLVAFLFFQWREYRDLT